MTHAGFSASGSVSASLTEITWFYCCSLRSASGSVLCLCFKAFDVQIFAVNYRTWSDLSWRVQKGGKTCRPIWFYFLRWRRSRSTRRRETVCSHREKGVMVQTSHLLLKWTVFLIIKLALLASTNLNQTHTAVKKSEEEEEEEADLDLEEDVDQEDKNQIYQMRLETLTLL